MLETRHGLLVEALADAGFTVLPVNPDLVARRRGPAKKKDDSEDARICCLMALDAYLELRKLIPHGETGDRAARHRPRRRARRPRRAADRQPAARRPAGGLPRRHRHRRRRPGRPGVPAAAGTLAVRRGAGRRVPRRDRGASPARPGTAGQAGSPAGSPRPWPRRGWRPAPGAGPRQGGPIRLAAAQLLAIRAQRRAWERRMGELLLGAAPLRPRPRPRRTRTRGRRSRAARST